jgi:peroxiredoxin
MIPERLPDVGDVTRGLGLLVERTTQGMGHKSWRYRLDAEDGAIKQIIVEPDARDNPAGFGLTASDAGLMLVWLNERAKIRGW